MCKALCHRPKVYSCLAEVKKQCEDQALEKAYFDFVAYVHKSIFILWKQARNIVLN